MHWPKKPKCVKAHPRVKGFGFSAKGSSQGTQAPLSTFHWIHWPHCCPKRWLVRSLTVIFFGLLVLERVFNWGKKSRLLWGPFMVGRGGHRGPFDSPNLRQCPIQKRVFSSHQEPTFGEFPCLTRPLRSSYSSTVIHHHHHHHPPADLICSPCPWFFLSEKERYLWLVPRLRVHSPPERHTSRSPPREFLAVRNKATAVKVRTQVSAWTSAVRLPASWGPFIPSSPPRGPGLTVRVCLAVKNTTPVHRVPQNGGWGWGWS